MFSSNLTLILKTLSKKSRKLLRKNYCTFVRKQGCIITGLTECDLHHLKGIKYGTGTGLKATDDYCLGLAREYHSELHNTGIDTFQEKYNIDLEQKLIELHSQFIKVMKEV